MITNPMITIPGEALPLGRNGIWRAGALKAAAAGCTTNPVVTNTADTGAGSLRQAITDACPGSTITFAVTGTITLTGGALDVEQSLTIQGPGAGKITINGNNSAQSIFSIGTSNPSVDATISGLTITGGNANGTSFAQGGGIVYAGSQTLTVSACTITGNQSTGGGAGIYCQSGRLAVTDSTISGNSSSGSEIIGVGIDVASGSATITGSTISGNTGSGSTVCEGGGVNVFGLLTMVNSTVTGNVVSANIAGAGGVLITGESTITSSTIAGNSASGTMTGAGGGLVVSRGSSSSIENTIIALNTAAGSSPAGPDVGGFVVSEGHNLIGAADSLSTGFTNGVNGDQVGTVASPVNPKLGPLQNNGGPTETLGLLSGSPAIDGGDDSVLNAPLLLAFDQRGTGFPRKAGAHVDIGAFEVQPPPFDTCLKDNTNGNLLQWNSTTGVYTFTDCATGFTLSGTGTAALVNNMRMLTDSRSNRKISAAWNIGQRTGTATIDIMIAQGVWQLFRINDTNPSAVCSCGG